MCARFCVEDGLLTINIFYPHWLIPPAAANQLLKFLAACLVDSSEGLRLEPSAAIENSPEYSILNFPPQWSPPSSDYESLQRHEERLGSYLLHTSFENWARRKPDAIAIDFVHSLSSSTTVASHSILTYATLDALATNLAVYLRTFLSTVQPRKDSMRIVPVYMSTSPELYISYLGILKAGHAFCPIPRDAPDARLKEILRDIDSPVILGIGPELSSITWLHDDTHSDQERRCTWIDVTTVSGWNIVSDGRPVGVNSLNGSLEPPIIKEDQIAYILFTSGSTGKPKGVQISHSAVTCSIQSHIAAIPLPGSAVDDFRWFQFASPTFDPSLMEIFVTLSSGATLCSAERSLTLTNPEATINETRATIMMATPSMAAILRPSRLNTLQSLWVMGEKLNRTVINKFAAMPVVNEASEATEGSSTTLVNAYGPTEGAINCTFLAPVKPSVRGSIIGRPLPTCSIVVLDPSSREIQAVPIGLVGELAIGGPQISKGYLNRPEETSRSFVHTSDYGYLYRTGDAARIVWDDAGCLILEFLGRLTSDQVKINGRRVELGEIESVLAMESAVTEVVAVVTNREPGQQGGEYIVACIGPTDGVGTEKQDIARNLREIAESRLPSYMCPSVYAFFDLLPRSTSGKVDRRAITAEVQQGGSTGIASFSVTELTNMNGAHDSVLAERSSEFSVLQDKLVQLLAETTGDNLSVISPWTSLTSLGMDSLGAMKLLQKFRDNSIEGLHIADILRAETPDVLASTILKSRQSRHTQRINGTGSASQGAHSSDVLRQDLLSFDDRNRLGCAERLGYSQEQILKVLPTTATQSGILTSFFRSSAHSSSSNRPYILHTILHIASGVDIDRLRRAWDVAIERYDPFRTVFCWVDDDMAPFAQCILDNSLQQNLDMSKISSEVTVDRAIQSAESSIDLSEQPWKLSIANAGSNTAVVLSMFHGMFDGGSLHLLLDDVSSVYYGKQPGPRTSLEHVVKNHFRPNHAATEEFWAKHLEHLSPAPFPSVTSYQPPAERAAGIVDVAALTSYTNLKSSCKKMNSTPLSVLQAVWSSVLLAYTGPLEQDVTMGSVVSGRFDSESEVCVGPTFTIVPTRLALERVPKTSGTWTNKSVARHLTALNAAALPYLQPRLGSLTMADGRLPYDTVLAFQDFNAGSNSSNLWDAVQHPPMGHDFAVMIEVLPGEDLSLTLRATFDNSYFDPNSAHAMLQQMSRMLAFVLENPEEDFLRTWSSMPIELKSSSNANSKIDLEIPHNKELLHTRFENHARLYPEDTALIYVGDLDNGASSSNITWTYAELDAKADVLASHLAGKYGAATNSAIPICIDKSPSMYIAILGILKAGAAWCPIDTFSPPQRRHDLIARTKSRILLVSSADGLQPEGSVPANVQVVDVIPFADSLPNGTANIERDKFVRPDPNAMAYLIWTSGTTGAPKGVPISHAAGVSCMRSLEKEIPSDVPSGSVRCLQFSQYSFDVSIQDIFYTWSLGGVLISATREILLGSFPRLANATQATHAHLTPAFAAGIPREACKTLRVITMIGEKLTRPVADDWGTDMRAFNTYGPAEATIVSTVREFGNEHKCVKSANIGWPLDTVSAFVTRDRRIVMENAIGELALGGPQLSIGYLNQEDVTKAKYIWNDEVSQVLYYTGDLVRMLSDGSLEYLHRVDDQVKLGGIRVELSEISYSLGRCHPSVENVETLILSRPDRPMDVIVAFLCASNAGPAETGGLLVTNDAAVEIARAASEQAHALLPGHMTPSVYLVATHIPRTQSAKTDRRALQQAYATVDIEDWEGKLIPEVGLHDVSPCAEVENEDGRRLIDIIAFMTGISSSAVTPVTRLGSLGVDSIRAVRLASKLNEAGYKLSVVDVINCATVKDLLTLVSSSWTRQGSSQDEFDLLDFDKRWHAAVASKVQGDYFTTRATPIQESLLSETMSNYEMYWSNHFFSLDESVDLQRLRDAWLVACQYNDALRIGFIPIAEVAGRGSPDSQDLSFLQLIYRNSQVDWESYRCEEGNFGNLLRRRVHAVMAERQKGYFKLPAWAVTVFDKGNERIMVLTIHHSLHDGPSMSLLLNDVRLAYDTGIPKRQQLRDVLPLVLPTEKVSETTNHFWTTELEKFSDSDVPAWPDLTGKRAGPNSDNARRLISKTSRLTETSKGLQSASAKLGVSSLASLLRTAWGCVTLGYLGCPAAVFGETLSDRMLHANFESALGPLISVVPVPFQLMGTVRELLVEQNRVSVQSRKFRHVHARKVRRILGRQQGQSLYPGLFTFHSASETDDPTVSNLWTDLEDPIGLHVEHPMAFNAYEDNNGAIFMEVSANSSVMSPDQLDLYLRQNDAFVSTMLSYPDEQVANIASHLPTDLLSVSKQLSSKNVTDSFSTSPTKWLEYHADNYPEWTAVEVASSISKNGIDKQTMSYGSLNAAANRVAAFIATLGLKNRMIALCSERSLASYPVIVGIFKSGNAYLPIDEGLPDERKAFLVEDGDCPLIFTESTLSDTFPNASGTCRVIRFDDAEFQKSLQDMPCDNRHYYSDPDDVAYLLYTSGSTGKPKGVMVTRGNLSSFIESISEFACRVAPATLELGGRGRYLAQASKAFDPHLLEMFFPWRHGMATVTGQRMMLLDDLELTLSKWAITHASLVPSLLDQASVSPYRCQALKFLTVGGEKISQRVLDTWGASPGLALVNAYGPTEATIGCTFALVSKESTVRDIGRPLNACVGHVLIPESLRYALRGQTGEICFSGSLVAKGYLNRPDAKGFVTGPHGERMYRTGDIGRLMPDDVFEYLGRGDDQTKIRGQRLELGEVSEVIRASSTVAIQVVTMVAKHPSLSRSQLVSFIARSGSKKPSPREQVSFLHSDFVTLGRELQDACRKKMPAFMVPEVIVPVSFIPLIPISAKANLKALQALFSDIPLPTLLGQSSPSPGTSPAVSDRQLTDDEGTLVREICNFSSVDPSAIGHLTNIFEIGLDSLSAIGLSVKLRSIGYDATVASVLSNPIVEQLARLPKHSAPVNEHMPNPEVKQKLHELELRFREHPPPGIDLSSVSAVRPCLPLQEGLVARSLNSEGGNLYVNRLVLQLNESVDVGRLRSAWQSVASRNDILRTAFANFEGGIVQAMYAKEAHEIRWEEDAFDSLDEAVAVLEAQWHGIAQQIIDEISAVPPLRFYLARSYENSKPLALCVAIHHSLYDGESLSMLLDDVAACYANEPVFERGSPAAYVEHAYSQDPEKSKQHWVRCLDNFQPTVFRTDPRLIENPRAVQRTLRSRYSDLERSAASLHTTVPALVQAVFALLLADTVGSCDVTYGIVLSGRAVSVPGAESVLLPCITTIPGRLNTENLSTINEVVKSTQQSAARSLEFQHTPLRHIQRWLMSEAPLFDCLFSFIRSTQFRTKGLWKILDSRMPAEYPFAIEIEANKADDEVYAHCQSTLTFEASHNSEEFLEKMDVILSSMVAGEDIPLKHFNLHQSNMRHLSYPRLAQDEHTWTTTEAKIRRLVSEFCNLDLEHVSKGASFLGLGIDSVTAIQFARKLRDSGLPTLSSSVMRFPCVGALASRIDEQMSKKHEVRDASPVAPQKRNLRDYKLDIRLLDSKDSISAMFECTPLQSAMLTQTLGSSGKVYVHSHIVRVADFVDTEVLRRAFSQVVKENDILRTSFHSVAELQSSWVGAVHTCLHLEWTEISSSSYVDVTEISRLFRFQEESDFEFPPLRAVLVNRPDGRYLVVVMHHALYDGVSAPFIFEDLALICKGAQPPKRPQFSDVVQHIPSNQNESCEFWSKQLLGYEVVDIPPISATECADKMFVAERRLGIETSRVIETCKAIEITVQTASLVAYAKTLACLTGRRDVVFGHVLAGRSLPVAGAERTMGPLFNSVAQRVAFEPKFLTNKSIAARLQQISNDAQVYQHAPLRVVQNMLRQAGSLQSSSLFDTLFVFQKSVDSNSSERDILTPYETPGFAAEAEHKLNFEVNCSDAGIVVQATCKGSYLTQATLDKVVADFETAFCDIIEHPTRCATVVPARLGTLPLRLPRPRAREPTVQASEGPAHEPLVRHILAETAGVKLETVTPETSIFRIGLDSLSAIRIAAICRTKGLKAGVADILQGSTLRGISLRIQNSLGEKMQPRGPITSDNERERQIVLERLQLESASVEYILPCLSGQAFHLASWLKSGRTTFEPAWCYSSRERIDADRLRNAWFRLRQRHPILRTCFVATSPSNVVQVVLKEATEDTYSFRVVDYVEPVVEAARLQAKEEAMHPSTLSVPPVRLRLMKAKDQDGIVILLNHAVYDAWTMPLLISELSRMYHDKTPETNPEFPSFVDMSLRTLRELDQDQYWTSAVGASPATILKGSHTTSSHQFFVGVWEKIKNLSHMESTCRTSGLGMQNVVLLAVARYLARLAETTSPTFGLYQTGRSAPFDGIELLSGPCLNVTPFTIRDVPLNNDRDHLLAKAHSIQSSLADRVPYEQTFLRDILLRWASTRDTKSPLFNTWVNLLWTQQKPQQQQQSQSSSSVFEEPNRDDHLFQPLHVGVPTDFIPSTPLADAGDSTSVSVLDTSYLPDGNVYIDIARDDRTDSVGFGVRVEGGVLSEAEVYEMVDCIAGDVVDILSLLSTST